MFKNVIISVIFIFSIALPVFAAEQININSASLQDLEKLTGIGPTYAQRIIDARPFSSIDDLDRVKGIGPKTLQKIKDQSFACVNCLSAQADQTNIAPESPAVSQNIEVANNTTPEKISPAKQIKGIVFSEIMPNPKGSDETDEWIKLYNQNNFDIDLAGWKIKDTIGTPSTFKISESTKILANNFLVFKRPQTKIMLNNDGDGLNLLNPDNQIIDSVNFSKAPLGQTYIKTSSGWTWNGAQTPLPKSKKSDKSELSKVGMADISLPAQTGQGLNQEEMQKENPWFLFYTTLATAILSAFAIIFIKFKLN